jgi:DNA-binding transcriptional ArsR family regulator
MEFEESEKVLSALAQETRLRVLSLLAQSDNLSLPAGDISLALGVPQNTLSFHLQHMEAAGLLSRQRKGRFIIYGLKARKLEELILFMAEHLRPKAASAP